MQDKSKRHHCKNKHPVQSTDVPSAIKPVSHGTDLPVPEPNLTMESISNSESSYMTDTAECSACRPEEDDQPVPLTQIDFNNLTRDLSLSKESAQLLGSRLQKKRLCHLEQHFIGIGNVRENLDIYSRLIKHLHCSTVTILLAWLNFLVWSMMLRNGKFSLTHLTKVSRQFFWITEISSHQSLVGTHLKWKNLAKAWNFCCLLWPTRNING